MLNELLSDMLAIRIMTEKAEDWRRIPEIPRWHIQYEANIGGIQIKPVNGFW